MKKIFYIILPLVMIVIVASYFKGNQSSAANASSSCSMTPQEYVNADKSDVVILDVRTQREYDYGHLEGAIVIDIYQKDFRDKVDQLDKNKTYFVYCKTGIRSRSAVSYMAQSGFKKVCDLQGGVNYLARAGVKMVK
jgi:rhodanese-related sulfurtransferase